MATVGDLEDRLRRHEDLLDGLDQCLQRTDTQVTQLWKQMDKVLSLERQQKEQEVKIREIQHWREQLMKTREREAVEFEDRIGILKGVQTAPSLI